MFGWDGWTRDDTEIAGVLQPQYLVVAGVINPLGVGDDIVSARGKWLGHGRDSNETK